MKRVVKFIGIVSAVFVAMPLLSSFGAPAARTIGGMSAVPAEQFKREAKAGLLSRAAYRLSQRQATGDEVAAQELQTVVNKVADWATFVETINADYLKNRLAVDAGLNEAGIVYLMIELRQTVYDLNRAKMELTTIQKTLNALIKNRRFSEEMWHTATQMNAYVRTILTKTIKMIELNERLLRKIQPAKGKLPPLPVRGAQPESEREIKLPALPARDVKPALPARDSQAPALPSRGAPALPSRGAPALPSRGAPALPERDVKIPAMPSYDAPSLPESLVKLPALPSRGAPALPMRDAPALPTRDIPEAIAAKKALKPTLPAQPKVFEPTFMEKAMAQRRAGLMEEEQEEAEEPGFEEEFGPTEPAIQRAPSSVSPVIAPKKLDKPIMPTKQVTIKTAPTTEKGSLLEQIKAGTKLKEVGLPKEKEFGKKVVSEEEKKLAKTLEQLSAFERAKQASQEAEEAQGAEEEEWGED